MRRVRVGGRVRGVRAVCGVVRERGGVRGVRGVRVVRAVGAVRGGGRGRGGRRRGGGRGQPPLDLLLLLQGAHERRLQPGGVLRLERSLDVAGDAQFAEAPLRGRRGEGGVLAARGRPLPAPHRREVAPALRAHRRHGRTGHAILIGEIVDDVF